MNTRIEYPLKAAQNDKDWSNGSLTVITGYNMAGCSLFLKNEHENDLSYKAAGNVRNRSVVYITPECIINDKPSEATESLESDGVEIMDIANEIDSLLSGIKDNGEFGVRTFRKLQSFIRSGILGTHSILVWDGVENFLHPEWQVIMTKLLIRCVKSGMHIRATTFSPYIVQGFRFFSHRYNVSPVYLLLKMDENGQESVHAVTHDLNQIFTMFALPLNRIINIE